MSSALAKIVIIVCILGTTAISAVAAAEARSNPSEPFVWGFLGLCALIIVAQIAPLISNLKKQSKITTEQIKEAKVEQL